jgi:hypothetical protein
VLFSRQPPVPSYKFQNHKIKNPKCFQLTATGLNLASSILLTNGKLNPNFIHASRIFGGIAFGLIYPVLIKHAADVAHPKTRGFIVGLVHSSIALGILINALSFLTEDALLVSGVCGVFFTCLGMLMIFLLTVESPLDLIKRNRSDEAIKVLAQLRNKREDDQEIKETHEDYLRMIDEDKEENSCDVHSKTNFFPILPAVLLKVSYVLSYNYTFNCLIMPDYFANHWKESVNASIVVASVRMLGVAIGLFTIDMTRIRHFYAISLTGIFALILSGLAYFSSHETYSLSAPALAIVFLISSGISLGVLPDVYASEIFSNAKKPVSLFFLVFVELGSQWLIFSVNNSIGMTMGTKAFHYGISGLMLLGIGIKLFLLAPETAKVSLREAKNMFRKQIDNPKPDIPV